MVLVGNKVDLDDEGKRQVTTSQGQLLAQEFGNIPFIECSALKGLNCDEVFHSAVRSIRSMDTGKGDDEEDKGLFSWCNIL